MLSIIIPTLNEEVHLKKLLTSIDQQKHNNYEIVIADAGSTDKTLDIAKEYNAVITSGGHPGVGRNKGARAASGDQYLFLDADVELPNNFLSSFFGEVEKRGLGIASCSIKIKERGISFRMGELVWNLYFWITQKFFPHGSNCIYATSLVHQTIEGFDENIKFGEEMDYLRKAAKVERFGFLWSVYFYASPRRFVSEGIFKTFIKYVRAEVLQIFGRKIYYNMFEYKGDNNVQKKNEKTHLS